MNQVRRVPRTLVLALLALPLLAGCATHDHNPAGPGGQATVNPDPPNANARIQAENTFGDPARWSAIYEMTTPSGLGSAFHGWYNDQPVAGRLSASGTLQWSARLPYMLMEIVSLSNSAPVPNGALVVGKDDTNGDGLSEVGYAWLISSSGTIKFVETFNSDTSDVWINGVAAVSDSEFVVVGGERTPARSNPYIARLVVTANGTLERRSQIVMSAVSNRLLSEVAVDPAGPSGGSLALYVASDVDVGVDQAISLQKVTVDYPSLASATVTWSRDVQGAGPSSWPNDLEIVGDKLLVCGGTQDGTKSPPGNGGYWDSGIAAALTFAGDVVWSKVLRASDHSDELFTIVPTPNAWYFVGDAARFIVGDTHEVFGYGLIEKLGLATGDELAQLTVGNATYASGFGTAYAQGGQLECGGWTQNEFDGGGNRAWFTGIDVSGTPAPTVAAVQRGATAVRADRAAPPRDRLPRR
jgi:hypothetical protein